MLVPFNTNAVTKEGRIDTTSTSGNTQTKVGEYFTISFSVWFWGLEKHTYETYGVGAVGFNIQMDDEDFIIASISSNIWDTSAYDLGDGNYYFISEYIPGSDDNNACIEKDLYCSSYTIDVEFFVKNTDKKNSSIIMTSATAGFIDLSKEYEEITEDDIIISSYDNIRTVIMTIQQPTVEVEYKEPNNTIEKTDDKHSIKADTQIKETNINSNNESNTNADSLKDNKSNNNNLKVLEIEGYSIGFSKDKKNYDVSVNYDVNSLKVNAISEDEKATIEIVGADNLKANDEKVLIKVKAENGDVNTYTVNIQRKLNNKVVEKENKEKTNFKLDKKYIIIGSIIAGCIIFITVIVSLIVHKHDKKIDKELDSL